MARIFDELLASPNAYTRADGVCFTLSAPPRHLAGTIELLSEILEPRDYPPQVVETERRLLLTEFASGDHAGSPFELIFPKHPLGLPDGGNPASIRRLSAEQILRFDRACFHPARIAVGLAGRLPSDQLDQARCTLARLPAVQELPRELAPAPSAKLPMLRTFASPRRITNIMLGFVSTEPSSLKEKLVGEMLVRALHGPHSSLYEQLRYSDSSAYHFDLSTVIYPNVYAVGFWARARLREVRPIVKSVLGALSAQRSPAAVGGWLERSRAAYEYFLECAADDPSSVAGRIAWNELHPESMRGSIELELELVRTLAASDVVALTERLFRRKHLFLSAGVGGMEMLAPRQLNRIVRENLPE